MNQSSMSSMNAAIERMRDRFMTEYRERHAELISLGLQIGVSGDDRETLDRAKANLHRTAGTAGTLGLERLGREASRAEERIAHMLKSEEIDPEQAIRVLVQFLDISESFVKH
ncbi:Hpt domain-containing protein [Loktanella sp. DSM 29012]|uniref:Hpt domain-containing protein n=1 Tax=Loktanella sp. DSM 29012 TaxID=1881056 RepID=UPI0008D1F8FA|nr:Hpt domain-containing protein [Loktanella sp. DSM 29012]SEP97847.1 Hpt domain-containing protein [Loktanella sp. DSM 29012]